MNYCIANTKRGIRCKNKIPQGSSYCHYHDHQTPTKLPDEEWVCALCLESQDEEKIELKCHHSFHKTCIEEYMSKLECPLCRSNIEEGDIDEETYNAVKGNDNQHIRIIIEHTDLDTVNALYQVIDTLINSNIPLTMMPLFIEYVIHLIENNHL
jgi:hypothetical protein